MSASKLRPDQYRCARCRGVFGKGLPDADAAARFEARFPAVRLEESALVCDDCFEAMKARGDFGIPPPVNF